MKTMKALALTVIALSMPLMAKAIHYINTDAPGVHLEVDKTTGENVWRNSNGDYLGTESESKPIQDMDKFYIYENNYVDKTSPYAPTKVWDNKRGCYVWKSADGDFLGRDISSVTESDLEWLSQQDPDWWDQTTLPEGKELLIASLMWEYQEKQIEAQTKKDQQALEELKKKEKAELAKKQATEEERLASEKRIQEAETEAKLRETDAQINLTDAEMRQAQKEIDKARAELRALGMTEYESYLDEAEAAIKQAQGASNQYKQKRGGK